MKDFTMNDFVKTVDGYKTYATAATMLLASVTMIYQSIANGDGSLTEGVQMFFNALALAGIRSSVTKVIATNISKGDK